MIRLRGVPFRLLPLAIDAQRHRRYLFQEGDRFAIAVPAAQHTQIKLRITALLSRSGVPLCRLAYSGAEGAYDRGKVGDVGVPLFSVRSVVKRQSGRVVHISCDCCASPPLALRLLRRLDSGFAKGAYLLCRHASRAFRSSYGEMPLRQ